MTELWHRIHFPGFEHQPHYEVSNWGRVRNKSGKIIKGSFIYGYPSLSARGHFKDNVKIATQYVHRIVTDHFLPPPNEGQRFVIHLDYDKTNNYVENLKWATKDEMINHRNESPERLKNGRNYKLNEEKVRTIKNSYAFLPLNHRTEIESSK